MNEKDDNRNQAGEPLESLLRRWGAEEAAREGRPGDMPEPAAPPAPRRSVRPASWAARWLPLAAGIVLGVSGLLGLLAARGLRSQTSAEVEGLRGDRDTAVRELQQVRTDLADAEQRRVRRQSEYESELAALRGRLMTEITESENAAARREAALSALIAEQKVLVASMTGNLAEARRNLSGAEEALRASRTAMERLREGHAADVSRLEAAVDDAATARRRAEEHLARLQSLYEAMLPVMQQAYTAGGELRRELVMSSASHLAARQSAARRHRLLERAAAVREGLRDEASGQLVDTIEVVLTRLDMLDARSASEAAGFAHIIARADLLDRIAKALRAGQEPPDVRAWLFEAQLLLMGVDHAS